MLKLQRWMQIQKMAMVSTVLTEDEDGDPVENGSHISHQPHDHSQLGGKRRKIRAETFRRDIIQLLFLGCRKEQATASPTPPPRLPYASPRLPSETRCTR